MYVGQPTFQVLLLACRDSEERGPYPGIDSGWRKFPLDSGPIPIRGFLGTLDQRDREDFLGLTVRRLFRRGEHVFCAGEPVGNVYLVQTGRVKFYDLSADGREIILWFCSAGDIFGLCDAAYSRFRNFYARACENSELLTMSQDSLKRFLDGHPQAAMAFIDVLLSRLQTIGAALSNLVSNDVNTRIAKLLLRLSILHGNRIGTRIYISIVLTHQEIADMVGATRQTVTSVLNQLKREGIISISRHHICIESEESLIRKASYR